MGETGAEERKEAKEIFNIFLIRSMSLKSITRKIMLDLIYKLHGESKSLEVTLHSAYLPARNHILHGSFVSLRAEASLHSCHRQGRFCNGWKRCGIEPLLNWKGSRKTHISTAIIQPSQAYVQLKKKIAPRLLWVLVGVFLSLYFYKLWQEIRYCKYSSPGFTNPKIIEVLKDILLLQNWDEIQFGRQGALSQKVPT